MSTLTVKSVAAPVGYKLAMPAGHILQVLQSEFSDEATTTSSSYQDIPLSVSITPRATSSKILVQSNVWVGVADVNGYGAMVQLLRGSTQICLGDAAGSRPRVTGVGYSYGHNQDIWLVTTSYLDSPSTTSATTYKLQFRSGWNGYNVYMNRPGYTGDNAGGGRTTSTITVMEVAG
jgi:hypothetical protein